MINEKKEKSENLFLNLLKATRAHRTLTVLATIMIPVGFADKVNSSIVFLYAALLFLYSAAAIQNAKKDNDYSLPSYTKAAVVILVLISLVFSLKSSIILGVIITNFFLGLFYNFYSRYILFMDVTVTAGTHHAIPILGASLLLGLPLSLAIKLSLFVYSVYWLFIHIKNLKDREDDKLRGYKTIATEFKSAKRIALVLFEISFILMFAAYFIFDFGLSYLIFIMPLFGLKMMISLNIRNNNYEKALEYLRFMSIFFVYIMVLQKAKKLEVIIFSALPLMVYFSIIIKDTVKNLAADKINVGHFSKGMNMKYEVL